MEQISQKCEKCKGILFKRVIGVQVEFPKEHTMNQDECEEYINNEQEYHFRTTNNFGNKLIVCSKCTYSRNAELT